MMAIISGFYRLFILIVLFASPLAWQQARAESEFIFTTQKQLLDEEYTKKIEDFWNGHVPTPNSMPGFPSSGKLNNGKEVSEASGIMIRYAAIIKDKLKEDEKGAIVISTGRTETLLKYKELAYDLWNNGYSVYIIDHRGQGLSDRERGLDDRQKGYVKDFGLFVSDFKTFIDDIVSKGQHKNLFLIAHSMGGAIATIYLEQNSSHPFRAVAFTSPMYTLRSVFVPNPPEWLISVMGGNPSVVTNIFAYLYAQCADKDYVVSGGAYTEKDFDKNEYTYDKVRYERLINMNNNNPSVKLGSPTHGWLARAFEAGKDAYSNASMIHIPVQLYQAGDDTIIHPRGYEQFCHNLPNTNSKGCGGPNRNPIVIEKAKHELLIEEDEKRNRVLRGILQFFKETSNIASNPAER